MTLCKHVKMYMCMLHVLLLSNIYLFSSRPDLECGSALHKAVDAFSTTVSDASASSLHNIQEDFGQQIWVCVLWCTPQSKVQTRLKHHPSNYMRQNCMTGEQNRTTDQTQSLKSKSKCKCQLTVFYYQEYVTHTKQLEKILCGVVAVNSCLCRQPFTGHTSSQSQAH